MEHTNTPAPTLAGFNYRLRVATTTGVMVTRTGYTLEEANRAARSEARYPDTAFVAVLNTDGTGVAA